MIPFNASRYLLDRQIEADHGARIAVRYQGRSVTYQELFDRVCEVASGLRSLGVRPEERVAMVLLDSPEFIATFLGAMRIGAVPVPLNPLLPARDLATMVASARATIAVVSPERASVAVPGLAEGAPELTDVVLAGDVTPFGHHIRVHDWSVLAPAGATDGSGAAHDTWEDSPGFWLCTSGTTGRPKLAMHRHVDLRTIAEGYGHEVLEASADDRFYSVAPLFHAYGLGNSLAFPLAVGATTILEPTRPPAPSLVASVVTAERPTLLFSVPTSFGALLAADLPPETFRSVRRAASAGEALPGEFFTRFRDRFGVEILDGIGSTEMAHIFLSNRAGAARPGTSGTPVAGYEIELRDDEGNVLAPGSSGHLFVRGTTAATGYYCQAEASRKTFRGEWTHTGDMYTSSADGFYSYLGRSDDMLKVGGEWVSPAEVEAVILQHAGVIEVAVVGETTLDGLTHPVACVVAAAGVAIDVAAVTAHCKGRLAGFKRPRRIVVMSDLPKTATGKIQRVVLRNRLAVK